MQQLVAQKKYISRRGAKTQRKTAVSYLKTINIKVLLEASGGVKI